jgi:hypothetical protein
MKTKSDEDEAMAGSKWRARVSRATWGGETPPLQSGRDETIWANDDAVGEARISRLHEEHGYAGSNGGSRAAGAPGRRPSKPLREHRGWHVPHALPHFDSPEVLQAITFRLAAWTAVGITGGAWSGLDVRVA